MRNKRGLNTEPWEIPESIFFQDYFLQLFVSDCKDHFPAILIGYVQYHKTLIWIRDLDARSCPKALVIYRKTARFSKNESKDNWITCTMKNKCDTQESSGKKPDWHSMNVVMKMMK